MEDVKDRDAKFDGVSMIILVCSTTGEGDPPDNASDNSVPPPISLDLLEDTGGMLCSTPPLKGLGRRTPSMSVSSPGKAAPATFC